MSGNYHARQIACRQWVARLFPVSAAALIPIVADAPCAGLATLAVPLLAVLGVFCWILGEDARTRRAVLLIHAMTHLECDALRPICRVIAPSGDAEGDQAR
jgi:hypothetical protein